MEECVDFGLDVELAYVYRSILHVSCTLVLTVQYDQYKDIVSRIEEKDGRKW
jgi:hypothetical protein